MHLQARLRPTSYFVDLTPLVDVVFLLLIFFMITSDVLPLKSLNIQVPELTQDSLPLTSQLVVVMDSAHVIYLGSTKAIVDLEELQTRLPRELDLLRQKNGGSPITLVLNIDEKAEYGPFLKLFAVAQNSSQKIRLVYTHQS